MSQLNPPVDAPFGSPLQPGKDGHPPGLFLLFFVEMWERFSFYGMRALLTFYLIKGFLKANDEQAYAIYGAYGALVYATPYLGGIFADRYLGARLAVIWGGALMAAGPPASRRRLQRSKIPMASESLGRGHAHLPHDGPSLGRRDLAVERLDGAVDLGHAAVVHGLAIIADPRDAAGAGGRQRLAAGAEFFWR